jgi:hypothetical protein
LGEEIIISKLKLKPTIGPVPNQNMNRTTTEVIKILLEVNEVGPGNVGTID